MKRRPAGLCAIALLAGSVAAHAAVPMPTLHSTLFADLTNLDMENDGIRTAASGTGVDVKRFYLRIDEKFGDTWSANVMTDANYISGQQVDVFIKTAYVQASLSKAFWGRLGCAWLPWIPLVHHLYGYRFVEADVVSRLHFGTTADWGLHGGGELGGQRVSYAVSVVNGNGYKDPTRSKSVDVEARLAVTPTEGLTVAIGGYSGKLGKDRYGPGAPTVRHAANRLDALIAYVGGRWRLGGEYFSASDWNNVITAASDKAGGTSLWASYRFARRWSAFGRWDQAKTSRDLAPQRKDEYFNAGIAVSPRKPLRFAIAYKHERVDGGGLVNTAYGNLGGASDGTVTEVGFWGQVSF